MKYIILVGDGMGDYPVAELNGKTPLAAARTPHMDWIADHGELGRVKTIPEGCETGSDTANLTLLGYNPKTVKTRRGPLEAASLGVGLKATDVAFRCNLVTLSQQKGVLTMDDYSAGHVTSDEAGVLVGDLDKLLGNEIFRFYPGVGYRHVMIWQGGAAEVDTTPPHDITGEPVQPHLERIAPYKMLVELMDRAKAILKDHPINQTRVERGLKPASDIWLWGQGHAPKLEPFEKKTGLRGAMISAVDLLKGIGVYIGLEVIRVPGATGYFDTDYRAKARYALSALKDVDLVYVHVEAPDEAGHAGSLNDKIGAIESFDAEVVGTVLNDMRDAGPCRLLVTTDHYTPLTVKTHTTEPVPFAIWGDNVPGPSDGFGGFHEESAAGRDLLFTEGHRLIERFIQASK